MSCMKKKSVVWGAAASLIFTVALSQVTSSSVSALERNARIWGSNRYETAVEVSKNGWKSSDYAVIVRGDEYADALCAAPLAEKYNAPILLTSSNRLEPEVKAELRRLNVKNVIIVGGSAVINTNVENDLKTIAKVQRIGGVDRYDTSVKVAQELGISNDIVVVSGENFPDALSIASIAAEKQMPILLTPKSELPKVVKDYIKSCKATKTYIIGGEGVVSKAVEDTVPAVTRLGGSNRYDTNVRIINEFKSDLNFDNIYVVVGDGVQKTSGKKEGFADALSVAPLSAKKSAPMVLTYSKLSNETEGLLKASISIATPKTTVTAIGGEAVVPDAIINAAAKDTETAYKDYSEAGKVYDGNGENINNNIKISADNVSIKNTNIKGNLYIYGNNANLSGVNIDGIIFVDPGDNGTVNIENVKCSNIKVRSGAQNSIHLNGATSDTLEVESSDSDNSVRIETSGKINIAKTIVRSNAFLDASNASLGNIIVSDVGVNNKNIEMKGKFTNPVQVMGSSHIVLDTGSSIATLNVSPENSEYSVSLDGSFSDVNIDKNTKLQLFDKSKVTGKLTVSASAEINTGAGTQIARLQIPENASGVKLALKGSGEVKSIQIKNKESSLSIPASINVSGKIETVDISTISAEDSSLTKRIEVKPANQMSDEAPVSANGPGGPGGPYNGQTADTIAPSIGAMTFSGTKSINAIIENNTINFNFSDSVTDLDKFTDGNISISENLSKVSFKFGSNKVIDYTNGGNIITQTNLHDFIKSTIAALDSGKDGISKSGIKSYFDGAVISITDTSGNKTDYTLRIFTSSIESLNNGQDVIGNLTLSDPMVTYGSPARRSTISGNVTINGDGANLNNATITGTLTIDPGDNGTVYLTNVHAVAINIISGAWNSVHLDGVTADSMDVSQDDSIRIVASNGTKIGETTVSSGGRLEVADDTGNTSLGNVDINSKGKSLELAGNFIRSNINVNGDSSVSMGDNSFAAALNISGAGAQVELGSNSSVSSVNVLEAAFGASITVGDNANAQTVSVNAPSSSLSLGANVNSNGITVGTTATGSSVSVGDNSVVRSISLNSNATLNVNGTNAQVQSVAASGAGATLNIGSESNVNSIDVSGSNISLKGNGVVGGLSVDSEAAKTFTVDGCSIKDGINANVTNSTGLAFAINSGSISSITMAAGNYKISEKIISRNITISGADGDITTITTDNPAFFSVNDGCILTLNKVTLNSTKGLYGVYTRNTGGAVCTNVQGLTNDKLIISYANIKDAIDSLANSGTTTINNAETVKAMISVIPDIDSSKSEFLAKFNAAVTGIYVKAANTALISVPEASTITKVSLSDASSKVNAARKAVNDAVGAGAVLNQFTGLEKLKQAQDRIEAINITINKLALVPLPQNISLSNLADARTKINSALAAVNAVSGAFTDGDLSILNASNLKVTSIENANTSLKAVPTASSITLTNLSDTKIKINAAQDAVSKARANGAADTDLVGLDRLEAAKITVAQIEKVQTAIKTANDAIAAVPDVSTITLLSNIPDVKVKIAAAEKAVADARAKGALDSDFIGLSRIDAAKKAVNDLIKNVSDAISLAVNLLKEIPDASNITLKNASDAIARVNAAQDAVNAAIAYKAANTDFVDESGHDLLYRIDAANTRISLITNTLKSANDALNRLPLAQSITKAMVLDPSGSLQTAINNAQKLVSDAKAFGASDSDFIGLEKIQSDIDKIVQIQKAESDRAAALKAANAALSLVPTADSIYMGNLTASDDLVQSAINAVNAARAMGTSDSEFIGLDKLKAASDKIKQLKQTIADKQSAIAFANAALDSVPAADSINEANLNDSKIKVASAESAVALARRKGAVDGDFKGLDKITAAEAKIKIIEDNIQAKSDAILKANNALKEIPSPEYINEGNVDDTDTKIKYAEKAISDAKALGAVDSDFIGVEKLQPAKDKVASIKSIILDKQAAVNDANKALALIPSADKITNITEANTAKGLIIDAESKIVAARSKGALDKDFIGLEKIDAAKAKIKQIEDSTTHEDKVKAAKAAVENAINAIPDTITETNLEEVRLKVNIAKAALKDAESSEIGLKDTDFDNTLITKLNNSMTAIEEIDKIIATRAQAVDLANAAISAVLPQKSINFDNAEDVKAKVEAAVDAVNAARGHGAAESSFIGIERIQEAKDRLALIDSIIKDEGALSVTYDGTSIDFPSLPAAGANGSSIVWSSLSPEIIDVQSGKVNRPLDSDVDVTLNAEVTHYTYAEDGKTVIDSISHSKKFSIHVNKLDMNIGVRTIGKHVRITVDNNEPLTSNTITITLYKNNNDNIEYIGQGEITDGRFTADTALDDGDYYGIIQLSIQNQSVKVKIKNFKVAKEIANVSTSQDFIAAASDEDVQLINLENTIDVSGDYEEAKPVTVKAKENMDSMITVGDGESLTLKNFIFDASNSKFAVTAYKNGVLKALNSTFSNCTSGISVTMSANADIENCTFSGSKEVGNAISQIAGKEGENPVSTIKENVISGFAATDAGNSSAGIYIKDGTSTVENNTVSGCYDGIAIEDGTLVNNITDGGVNTGLTLINLNANVSGNIRSNVIVFKGETILYKDNVKASAKVTVDNNTGKVTIVVTMDAVVNGEASIKLLDAKGNLAYADQKNVADGICTFETMLPNGDYTGLVSVPGGSNTIAIDGFNVNKPDAVTADVTVNGHNVTIKISSAVADNAADITMIIYKETSTDIIANLDQAKLVDGAYTFNFTIDEAGIYYGVVKVGGTDKITTKEFIIN